MCVQIIVQTLYTPLKTDDNKIYRSKIKISTK